MLLLNPLQFFAPFAIIARMLTQETWLLGLDWDEEFPSDLQTCQEWISQLPELSEVQVPRRYRLAQKNVVDSSILILR